MSDATTKGPEACKEAQTESSLQLGDKSCGGDLAVSTSMTQGGGPEVLYCGGTSHLRTSKATAPSPPAQHTHILPGTSGRLTTCRSDTCERHQHGQQQRPPLRQQTWGRVSLKCALRGRTVAEVLADCRGGPQVPKKPDPPPATNNQALMRGSHVQDERAAIVRASHHNQRGGVVTVVERFSQS